MRLLLAMFHYVLAGSADFWLQSPNQYPCKTSVIHRSDAPSSALLLKELLIQRLHIPLCEKSSSCFLYILSVNYILDQKHCT
jgi:hypothetical protein